MSTSEILFREQSRLERHEQETPALSPFLEQGLGVRPDFEAQQ